MLSESQIIEKIRRAVPSRPEGFLQLGIGDDAAVLHGFARNPSGRRESTDLVLTSDSFLDGRHFLVRRHPAQSVGHKALARAVSDIAAMGGVPRVFLLNLALPGNLTGAWLDRFLEGMARAARSFEVILAGGDTSSFPTVAINISVLGEVPKGKAIKRSGAQPGDLLFVSGALGAARLGLQTILTHRKPSADLLRSASLRPHLFPVPRLGLGQWLATKGLASAMIDISDGFSTDLSRLCRASRVGAHIREERVPCSPIPKPTARAHPSQLELALHGGDDYELLFSVHSGHVRRIPSKFHGLRITQVGEVTRGQEIVLHDRSGRASKLVPRGWDHFR